MNTYPSDSTNTVMFLRLRNSNDDEAWRSFVERYTPRIYAWCRRFRLQDSDAADVTQNVLARMVVVMRKFDYNRSRGTFRAWLRKVTQNAVMDLMRDWEQQVQGSGDTTEMRFLSMIQDPRVVDELAKTFEEEHKLELLAEAEQRVQLRVKPHTWQAYVLTAVEQIPSSVVAQRLEMRVSDVYVSKSRVIKLLHQEVAKLERISFHGTEQV